MKTLKIILLPLILVIGNTVFCMAQEQKKVLDPKMFFDDYASMVTLKLKDNTTQSVNLIYNNGSTLFYKKKGLPGVARLDLSNVTSITYADGSVELIYGGSTLSNSFSATSAALTSLYSSLEGDLQTTQNEETEEKSEETGEESKEKTEPLETGETRIIFEPLNARRAHFIDVMIDGEYATSIDTKNGTVLTAPAGDYYIEYNLLGNDRFQTDVKVRANANNSYFVKIPDKIRGRNIRKMTPRIEEEDGLQVMRSSNYQNITLGERTEWSNSIHPFNHFQFSMNFLSPYHLLPTEGTFLSTVGGKLAYDFTLGNAKGFYLGYSHDFSYSTYSVVEEGYNYYYGYTTYEVAEYELVTTNVGPALTYYFMNGKHFVPFAGMRIPFVASRIDDEIQTKIGFDLRIGSHLYLSKTFGITSEVITDVEGNTQFHTGITFRFIPKRNAKYRGTYWYDY